jgi:hypothetical protein
LPKRILSNAPIKSKHRPLHRRRGSIPVKAAAQAGDQGQATYDGALELRCRHFIITRLNIRSKQH